VATIHERRKHEKWMIPTMGGVILALLLQFAGIIWWGSAITSKTNVAYAFAKDNHNVSHQVSENKISITDLKSCSESVQDLPNRVYRLEEETDELQDLPSAIATLNAKLEALSGNFVDMRQDTRNLQRSIDSIRMLLLRIHPYEEDAN
jgi:hypothetical protein